MARRRPSWNVAALDWILVGLVVFAALPLWLVAVSQDAGPFGAAVLPTVALLVLAVPLGLVRIVSVLAGRRSPTRSHLAVWAAVGFFAVGVAAIPSGGLVARWRDQRAERRMAAVLDERASACATEAAQRVPDEPETNPGVEIRPRMTSHTTSCVEALDSSWQITCLTSACQVTPPIGMEAQVLIVDLVGYMDEALRTRTGQRWNRWPQPGFRVPERPWVTPGR